MLPDIDFKRPKVNVYVPTDIFSRCSNPREYDIFKQDYLENNEDIEDMEEVKKSFFEDDEGDFDNCVIKKTKKEECYNEEDKEFMRLIPDPSESKLYELTQMIQKERNRRI